MNLIPSGNSSICVKIGTKLFFWIFLRNRNIVGFVHNHYFVGKKRNDGKKRNGMVSFLQRVYTINLLLHHFLMMSILILFQPDLFQDLFGSEGKRFYFLMFNQLISHFSDLVCNLCPGINHNLGLKTLQRLGNFSSMDTRR